MTSGWSSRSEWGRRQAPKLTNAIFFKIPDNKNQDWGSDCRGFESGATLTRGGVRNVGSVSSLWWLYNPVQGFFFKLHRASPHFSLMLMSSFNVRPQLNKIAKQAKDYGASLHCPCYFLCILRYFKIKQGFKRSRHVWGCGSVGRIFAYHAPSLGFYPQHFTVWWCIP